MRQEVYTINELSKLGHLSNGQRVKVFGVGVSDFENSSVRQYPSSDWVDRQSSEIWIEGIDDQVSFLLDKANCRKVNLTGKFYTFNGVPADERGDRVVLDSIDGFGHFNQWLMLLQVDGVEFLESRVRAWFRRD